jgi:galactose mutarotase-like enzyme
VIQDGGIRAVVSSKGGTILSLTRDGEDIFYPYTELPGGKTRGGCFVCAPVFGSSSFFEKKHGFVRDTEAHDAVQDENSISLVFVGAIGGSYVWPLTYRVHAHVIGNIFFMSVRIERSSAADSFSEDIPVLPAFHPYFSAKNCKERVTVGSSVHTDFSRESKVFSFGDQNAKIAKIAEHRGGIIVMRVGLVAPTSVFPACVLWSDNPDKYFCVEPVAGRKESFNTSEGLFLRKKGDFVDFSMRLFLL